MSEDRQVNPSDAAHALGLSLEKMVQRVGALIDQDATYNGSDIILPMPTHGDAIVALRDARGALAVARLVLHDWFRTPAP